MAAPTDSTTLRLMAQFDRAEKVHKDSLIQAMISQPERIQIHHDFAALGCGAFFLAGMALLAWAISRHR